MSDLAAQAAALAVEDAAPAPAEAPAETPAVEGAAPAAAKPPVSEVARLARDKRRLEARIAELERAPATERTAPPTRDAILADLKKQYQDDPEAFLEAVAGEDFYALAGRVSKKTVPVESKVEQLERELAELKGERVEREKVAAEGNTAKHIEQVSKEIEAKDAEGNPKYPTLASMDPEALDEPIGLTAYNAVAFAWQKECCRVDEKTGKLVQFKKWTNEEVEAKFKGAFSGLEKFYAKLRTPRAPSTPASQDPELSPTISDNHSPGTASRHEEPAPGTMSMEQALRKALKEHGLPRY